MGSITERLNFVKKNLKKGVRLVVVSKFQNNESIIEAYNAGHRLFGESRVQELCSKYRALPKDIEWHFIGHLQTNKLNYIIPFVNTIHSVDSLRLLDRINHCALKYNSNYRIKILLQMHIAQEPHKFGFSFEEIDFFLEKKMWKSFRNIDIVGLMGMATFTKNQNQIKKEFTSLSIFFSKLKNQYFFEKKNFKELSIGMSDDYLLAVECGSTLVRIGRDIFCKKN
ncbi:MAG: YggS family pyridoxal phosphate-dependent enzyme [Bacteroidales bacterium OttesenSCG-928-I14]|jgi:pyridoxal phosphate enzyme (YggS family)|nr:YggS family pyridoxal phosphate-dependent enzyme [Bacteroidales bacterium OttesenSCG-928-I14]